MVQLQQLKLGKGSAVWAPPSENLSQKERSAFRISESTFLAALSGNLSKDWLGLPVLQNESMLFTYSSSMNNKCIYNIGHASSML